MPEIIPSEEVRRRLVSEAPRLVLKFSGGKDSLALAQAMLEAGYPPQRMILVYHYWVPGLELVERSLAHYERHFGVRIVRVPHVALYQILASAYFQPPHRALVLDEEFGDMIGRIRRLGLEDVTRWVVEDLARKDAAWGGAWIALGVRAADSSMRRLFFKRHGSWIEKKRTAYPIWDWRGADIRAALERGRIPLPPDYPIWGRSFDGIDYRFLVGLRERAPRDYERVLAIWPGIEAEFARAEVAKWARKKRHRSSRN